jgi:hypothetical protein
MRKPILLALITVGALTIAFLFVVFAWAQSPDSNPAQAEQSQGGSDSNPVGQPLVIIPQEYQPSANAPQAVARRSVYFTPQDENTSDTIIFLYNTAAVTQTVPIRTYYINGSLTISTTVSVPPAHLVRISGDTVSTISASWSNYVLINFTTFSAYAKMDLPDGVKAEAYVAWDPAGIYDPLTISQTLPIRFSSDPLTVFMPLNAANTP